MHADDAGRLKVGRFCRSLLAAHGDRQEVVKLFTVPESLSLLEMHLETLEEVNRIAEDADGYVVASRVAISGRTILLRRPYTEQTLEAMYGELLAGGCGQEAGLAMDGRRLGAREVRWVAQQLVLAVQNLHRLGLSHGSLQPSNVLVDSMLNVRVCDLSPYKPYHLGGADDPSFQMYFYDEKDWRYIAPERIGRGAGGEPDMLLESQRADVYSLGVILRDLVPGDWADRLLEARDVGAAAPLFAEPVLSFALPLLRHAAGLGIAERLARLEASLDDIVTLGRAEPEMLHVVSRYLLGCLHELPDESLALRWLGLVRQLGVPPLGGYLENLAEMGVSEAVRRAIAALSGAPEAGPPAFAAEHEMAHFAHPHRVLRTLLRFQQHVGLLAREELLRLGDACFPALLIHPSDRVRLAAGRLLRSMGLDEADRLAYYRKWLLPVVPGLALCTALPEDLLALVDEPVPRELFDLVLRNVDQLPRFLDALAPREAARIRLIERFIPDQAGPRLAPLDRKRLQVNPVAASDDEHSPMPSPTDSFDDPAVPREVLPSSYRHFRPRSLPFQFDTYEEACVSRDGRWFALGCATKVQVWRACDFRGAVLPEPWASINGHVACLSIDGDELLCAYEGGLEVYSLRRQSIVVSLECGIEDPRHVRRLAGSYLVSSPYGLSLVDPGGLRWESKRNPAYHGPVTAIAASDDGIYVVTGSANGYLSLWDARYGLCLRSWRLPLDCQSVLALSLAEQGGDAVAPPRMWLAALGDDGQPMVMIVDLALASVVQCTADIERELLGDIEHPPCSVPPCGAMLQHRDWALLADPDGRLLFCQDWKGQLRLTTLHEPTKRLPTARICMLEPTSMTESRSLSLLCLHTDGSCSLLECSK